MRALRVLVATPFLPHPQADHGGGVYLALLLRALAERVELQLVANCQPEEISLARDMPWFARIDAIPVPRLAAPTRGRRALEHARLAWLWGARRLPLLAAKLRRRAALRALHDGLRRRPDVALLEFAVMAQYLPTLRRVPTILTDHERGGHAPAGVLGGDFGRARDERLWRRYMHRFYPQASLLQAVNEGDARFLAHTLHRPVEVRPVLVDLPARAVDVAQSEPRALFLGDYAHHPNSEAATFLAEQVWPAIHAKAPGAELWLAGPRAPQSVRQLERIAGVRYLGFVADLYDLLRRTRVLLAPVLSGDGSRVKVLTALAHGLPVVANARAFAGLTVPEAAGRRGETAAELATLALGFLDDTTLAAAAGRRARTWAESELLTDAVVEQQLQRMQTLVCRARR